MSITSLEISEAFFTTLLIQGEAAHDVTGKCIVLNLSEEPMQIEQQRPGQILVVCLGFLQSSEDVDGVKLKEACVSSNNKKNWVKILQFAIGCRLDY